MKNILIVDGAENCAYDIFSTDEDSFAYIFPNPGQDVQFFDEIIIDDTSEKIFSELWRNPVKKSDVNGIHGVLFYGLDFKKDYYPNRKDSDLDYIARSWSSRATSSS